MGNGNLIGQNNYRYQLAQRGQLWCVSHQTPGTGVTGQTAFDATTPTFLIRSAGTKRKLLDRLVLGLRGTAPGDDVDIVIAVDPVDRLSAATGTLVTPYVPHTKRKISDDTADFTFRYNPTAIAAGTDDNLPRFIHHETIGVVTLAGVMRSVEIDLRGKCAIEGTGSILVYTWSGTTGPTWGFTFDIIEEPLR